jgi:hypothetical protein
VISIWLKGGERLYLPVLPMLLIYGWRCLEWLEEKYGDVKGKGEWIRVIVIAGILLLVSPLAVYAVQERSVPGVMGWLRDGYIYTAAAVLITGGLLVSKFVRGWKMDPVGHARLVFVVLYLSLFGIYGLGDAALEQGVVTTRARMLEGYRPYHEMGLWLGEQGAEAQPVLCCNFEIVHFASGKLTGRPDFHAERTKVKLLAGEYPYVLVIEPESLGDPELEDEYNGQIRRIIGEMPERFRIEAAEEGAYRLYRWVP